METYRENPATFPSPAPRGYPGEGFVVSSAERPGWGWLSLGN